MDWGSSWCTQSLRTWNSIPGYCTRLKWRSDHKFSKFFKSDWEIKGEPWVTRFSRGAKAAEAAAPKIRNTENRIICATRFVNQKIERKVSTNITQSFIQGLGSDDHGDRHGHGDLSPLKNQTQARELPETIITSSNWIEWWGICHWWLGHLVLS